MNEQTQAEAQPQDFAVNVYKGCVLPEDYRAKTVTTWLQWVGLNPDDYSESQLELIRVRLLAGKSWVCFVKNLQTISALDHYKPVSKYSAGTPVHQTYPKGSKHD